MKLLLMPRALRAMMIHKEHTNLLNKLARTEEDTEPIKERKELMERLAQERENSRKQASTIIQQIKEQATERRAKK